MRLNLLFTLLMLVAIGAQTASATVYQYFDEEGTIVITESPHGHRRGIHPNVTHYKPYRNAQPPDYLNDVTHDFYPVEGSNIGEVIGDANSKGPFDSEENRRFPAQTRWSMGWAYDFDYTYRVEGFVARVALSIKNLDMWADIKVTLPRLKDGIELGLHDRALWDEFFSSLLEHEHEHVNILREPSVWNEAVMRINALNELSVPYEAGDNIDAAIKKAVKAETHQIGLDMVRKLGDMNDEFDRATEHGAVLPKRGLFLR